ncbi:polymorphic toxin-type HINT domain-containing protein [Pseudalkalibacillus sp. SCS-8]|uniref:polymorphic toxin-type HINT domain-containing protein n=1 Tax=Pseudalkalibacillus nanhaiensis TaxID=3115291 RepID=UPI0032DA0425
MMIVALLIPMLQPYEQANAVTNKEESTNFITPPVKSFPKKSERPVELKTKRTKNQKVLYNPDGTFTTKIYSKPIHYKNKKGNWKEINNDFVLKGKKFVNKENRFKVKLDKTISQRVELDDSYIQLTPTNTSKYKLKNQDNKITYTNVYRNVDISYTMFGESLKEDIVLLDKDAQTTFVFEVDTNLTPVLNKNGDLEFLDENKQVIFLSPKPFAYDDNGVYTEDVHYEINNTNNTYELQVVLNEAWAHDSNRKFPIIVDPTITNRSEDDEIKDAFIASGYPTQNYDPRGWLAIATNGYGINRTLIDLEMPSLISGANITNVTLDLYQYTSSTDITTAQLFPVTKEWDVKTVNWNNQPTIDSNKILAQYTGNEISTWSFSGTDLTNFIRDIYAGKEVFHGFMIKALDESQDRKGFYSSESGNAPELSITYEVKNEGMESFWAFDNGVNLLTGNFVTGGTDFLLPGRGIPIGISRNYNSQSDYTSPHLGDNWRFDFEMHLNTTTSTGDTDPITFTDEDGTDHIFIYDQKLKKYIPPSGIQLKLYKDKSSGYRYIESVDKTKYRFTSTGELNQIEDSNGNITTFEYTIIHYKKRVISKITDTSGRSITFSYLNPDAVWITGDASIMPFDIIYTKNASNQLVSVKKISHTTSDVVETKFEYSGDNLSAIIDNSGNRTEIQYDAKDQVESFTQVATDTLITSYRYSETGEGVQTIKTNPKGIKTRFTVNGHGNLTKVEKDFNESTGTSKRTFEQVWDENNMLAKVIDPKGNSTVVSYDENGNTEEIQNAKGHKTLMKYDDDRNMTQVTGFMGDTYKSYYDSKGNQQSSVSMVSSGTINDYQDNGNLEQSSSPISLGYNLIRNSGFEDWDSTLPEYWFDFTATGGGSGRITKDTTVKKNGENSLQLYSTSTIGKANVVSEPIPVFGNIIYNLSWDVTTSNLNKAEFWVRYLDSNHQLLSEEKVTELSGDDGAGWTRQSSKITIPDYAWYVKVQIKVDTGKVWLDNVQLQESAFVNDYNFTTNNGFESDHNQDGLPDNWKSSSSNGSEDGLDTSVSKTKKNSVYIEGNTTSSQFFVQEFNIPGKKGDKLIWSGYSKSENVTNTSGKYDILMRIDYTDGTTHWNSAYFNTGTHDWEFSEDSKVTDKDYNGFAVYTRLKNETGKAWFDDIVVKKEIQGNPMISQYNIIQNGSFEMYDYNGDGKNYAWQLVGSKTPIVVANDEKAFIGERYAQLTGGPSYSMVAQDHLEPVEAGSTYTFTAMTKAEGITNNGAYLNIRYYDANKVALGTVQSKLINGTSEQWKRFGVELDSKKYPQAKYVKAFITLTDNSNGKLLVDAARFEEQNLFTSYDYDNSGNYVTRTTDEDGDTTTYNVDPRGNLTRIDFPIDGTYASFEYDWLDRVTATEDATGLRKELVYNTTTGNVDKVKYVNNSTGVVIATTSQTYNSFGEIKSFTDALNHTTTYYRDEIGNITDIEYPTGGITHYQHNNLNEITNVTYTNDPTTWSFTYDTSGNMNKMVKNGTEVTDLTFDPKMDQVTNITYPSYKGKRHKDNLFYNPSGLLTIYDPSILSGQTTHDYYDSGMPSSTQGANGETLLMMYDESGRISKIETQLKNGKTSETEYKYTESGFMEKAIQIVDGNVKIHDTFSYDANGNLISINHYDGSKDEYTYDVGNRLTKEVHKDQNGTITNEISYSYDVMGNRTSMTKNNSTITYTYDTANQLTSINGSNTTHDANGNLKSDAKYQYFYDVEDQLVRVENGASSVVSEYEYDYEGLRTKKVTSQKTEYYYYMAGELSYITDENNNLKYSFTRTSTNRLVSMTDHTGTSPKTYEFVMNHRGDVLGLRDTNGTLVVEYEYDAWGNILSKTGSVKLGNGKYLKDENPFRYAGDVYDEETGFYYLKQRYYNPETGRFLTRDDVPSHNLYVYAGNNPSTFTDANGNFFDTLLDIASTVVSAVRFAKKPSWKNAGYLAWDLAATFVPFVPGSYSYKAVKYGKSYAGNMLRKMKSVSYRSSRKASKGKACNCFTAGTKVLTDQGEKPIDEIKVGDKVLAKSDKTGEVAYKDVVGLFQKQADEIYYIHIGDEIIEVTAEHPFWLEGIGWTLVKDLNVGDLLHSSDGTQLAIEKIEKEPRQATVYNFEVADYHSYFVSNLGIWVHNCSVKGKGKDLVKSNKGNEYDITPMPNHTTTTSVPNPNKGIPSSSVDILDKKTGQIKTRRYHDIEGRALRDVDFTNHGNPKSHPEWPHEHIFEWDRSGSFRRK